MIRIFLVLASTFTLASGSPVSRQARAVPEDERSVAVDFEGHAGLDLHGTLRLPAKLPAGGAPALVLLPGSGPTDRDGNQKPYLTTDLLKQLAESLAEEGIATLRFDKRASRPYHLRLMAMTAEQQDDFFAWDAFVGDALAALATLRAREETDVARCGLLGHSEGGLIALEAARRTADTVPPAVLVLASTAGTDMADVLRYQIPKIIRPYPEDVRAKLMVELDRVMAEVVETNAVPADVPPGLQALFPANCADLLANELALDPAELARGVRGPVLVLAAEHDAQIPPEPNVELLAAGLRARAGDAPSDVVVVPGASHNLKAVASSDEMGFEGDVVPAALSELRAWLARHLVGDGER